MLGPARNKDCSFALPFLCTLEPLVTGIGFIYLICLITARSHYELFSIDLAPPLVFLFISKPVGGTETRIYTRNLAI